jgi:hypothetical protein
MTLAAEIQRANQQELAAKLNEGEAALSAAIVQKIQPPAVELDDKARALLAPFVEWCTRNNVRRCAAKAATVAAFVLDQAASRTTPEHILATLGAIELLHDLHRLSNPVQTQIVHAVLGQIVKDPAPRSWTKDEQRDWPLLPPTIKAAIARRERERDTYLRKIQTELADLKKQLKPDEPKAVTTQKEKV